MSTEYLKINCGLAWMPDLDFHYSNDGIVVNRDFSERLSDYVGFFKMKLLESINEIVGETGWAIYFTQYSAYPEKPFFYASIFLDNADYYEIVEATCRQKLESVFDIEYRFRGNVAMYLAGD